MDNYESRLEVAPVKNIQKSKFRNKNWGGHFRKLMLFWNAAVFV